MDFVLLDYATLRVIWWLLLGVLLSGYAVMGGFDLGVSALLPFVASDDVQRRLVINTIGPVWEGSQVWLILGGGAIFAAFPPLYAVSFSGFYLAMFVILFALILRPVGFKFRGKLPDQRWRDTWDWALFVGGFIPALILGVAVGNVLLGVPFHFDDSMRTFYTGNLLGLLSPFALLAGLLSVAMLLAHGAAMLVLKTDGPVAERAARLGSIAAWCAVALFAAGGAWVALGLPGYAVTSVLPTDAQSNPLAKTAALTAMRWLAAQLPQHAGNLAGAVSGTAGPGDERAAVACATRRPGLHRLRQRHCRHHLHRGVCAVSVPAALLHRTQRQPDAVGCLQQPAHAVDHAAGHHRVHADHPGLHRLGLSRAARQGHCRPTVVQSQRLLSRVGAAMRRRRCNLASHFHPLQGAHRCGISPGFSAPAWLHWPPCSTACGSKRASRSKVNRRSKKLRQVLADYALPM